MNLKYLWDYFTDNYSLLPIHPQYFIKKYTHTAVALAQKHAKGILVDIGCGRMPYRRVLIDQVKRYIGIDHPSTSKLYFGNNKPDIYADATKIPLPSESCDTILSLQVLEHLPEPNSAIKEINRLLKREGVLILSTIQSYPLHDRPFDFYRYTRYSLEYLLKKNGFSLIELVEEGNVLIQAQQSINIYLMLILKNMSQKENFKYLAILLTPPILIYTTFLNLLFLPLNFKESFSGFKIILTVVARKNN